MVNVRCKNRFSLLNANFEPIRLKGNRGLFVSKARVLPNINDIFQVTVLNVTESDVTISYRPTLGVIHKVDGTIVQVKKKAIPQKFFITRGLHWALGTKWHDDQKKKVNNLLKEYEDVFAANPKKPKRTTVTEHQIITGDSLPVKQKTRRIPDA